MEHTIEEIHIGKEIKRIVKEQGRQTQWLAEKLNYDRNNIYDIYKRRYIDTGVLLRLSNALEYDFFALYSQQINKHAK
ncbi:MAG: XRE family transcriptional regulator [Bacteroidales bacterium]|nr:XRE family transcriptional regulator [Bacteroidales bacterium]